MSPTSSKTTEEPKQTLPAGHPQAGYVSPDLSFRDGVGTLPDSEEEWHAARDDARQAEVDAVAENEDKVAKEEAEAQAKAAEPEPEPKTPTAKTSTASTSS